MPPPTIAVFSGGLDSTVLLYWLLSRGHHVRALSVYYGQRHRRELDAAKRVAGMLDVEHVTIDLGSLQPLMAGSSQTSDDVPVPDGHYADASMAQTVVPNRNAILLAVGVAWAISTKSQTVAYGAHGGDHPVYWDCRPAFIDAQHAVYILAEPAPVEIQAPFRTYTKAEIVHLGASLGVPFGATWSCYRGEEMHCGRCGTCTERREAFMLAKVPDPTQYMQYLDDSGAFISCGS